MSEMTREWKYLERRPGSSYQQLSVKGKRNNSLTTSRNEFNHVVLACRSTENCQHARTQPRARLDERSRVRGNPRLVNQEEHLVISGDALPEIGLPAETTSRP
jgi:hypothetical protein